MTKVLRRNHRVFDERPGLGPAIDQGWLVALAALWITCIPFQFAAAALAPAALRCEYLTNPAGLDEPHPRLTWRVEAAERGQRQTAYQILVASDESALKQDHGDLWDSGKVTSDQTVNIVYEGKPLPSRQICYWKVRVFDKTGAPSDWSKPARWSMGLLKASDWKAGYISFTDSTPIFKDAKALFLPPAQQYRKEFVALKAVRRATAYATALGIYEMQLNGTRAGDACFTPGWCDYRQRAYYNTIDVTPLIHRGTNAWAAWVADGWYSGYIGFGLLTGIGTEHIGRYTYGKTPSWMGQLEIEYEDGSSEIVITDPSWKVTGEGPIQEADLLMGESYDARKEMPGWSQSGFDDSHWQRAIRASDNSKAVANFYEFQNPTPGERVQVKGRPIDLGFVRPPRLESFPGNPVRQIEELRAVSVKSPGNGVYIFNLGQNFAGVIRLKVKGPAGTQVRIRYGEMLHPDGRLMTENLRRARATDFYTLRGDPEGESYVPRFTFHGFQYVELTGFPGEPKADAVTGIVMHSDTPFTSDFDCSDPVINRLFKNVVWTQRANFLDLPTDCPQRDERFGWTGDAQAYVRTATFNADVAAFYTKWIRELMESQRPSGTFPGYAPFPFQHGMDFGTAWCDAGVICPWTIYKAYGDTRIIERCWPAMVRFMAWRKSESKESLGVVHGNGWGDWLSVNENTPLDYIDTIYFGYTAKLMVEMGRAIGKTADVARYQELFENIKQAFGRKYVRADGALNVDTQTAYALALFADLVPEQLRQAAGEHLGKKIRDNGSRMTTGFLGTRPLLPALASVGQTDLAIQLLQSRKFPSWGYEVEQGATTVWERWNSFTLENGFGGEQNASMNSFAHYAFGAVCEWMFTGLAGIDSDGPGYHHILIRPAVPAAGSNPDEKPIDWVRAHYDCIHGRIASSWKWSTNNFKLDLTIPANTTATVYLPGSNPGAPPQQNLLSEGGRPLAEVKGVRFARIEGNRAVLEVESGKYQFEAK
jgi:alpha-L-rhamnosidase